MQNQLYTNKSKKPLFVDLDGSLIFTDTLWESISLLIRHHPLLLPLLPLWLFKGKASFKKHIADIVIPDAKLLPYNDQILDFLKSEHGKRPIYLVTAADQRIADAVKNHLGLFTQAIGSHCDRNLRGSNKLHVIKKIAEDQEFEYIGNEDADLVIWKESSLSHVVTSSKRFAKRINDATRGRTRTYLSDFTLTSFVKAIRPHQWVKNVLVFAPFILAHRPLTAEYAIPLILAFICLSLCASAVYLFNDILDIESDRSHPDKRKRPFAAGHISIQSGIGIIALFLTLGMGASLTLMPIKFGIVLIAYLGLTTIYTIHLKKLLLVDIICLSLFYTLRVYLGRHAIDVPISLWFLAFSSFFFLCLAFAKRYIELINTTNRESKTLKGRGYQACDMPIVLSSGLACGYMSVLVLFLYITNSPVVDNLYSRPIVLWLFGPILAFWITRIWILANRKQVHSDPVLFAIKDKTSWLVGIISAMLIVAGALIP